MSLYLKCNNFAPKNILTLGRHRVVFKHLNLRIVINAASNGEKEVLQSGIMTYNLVVVQVTPKPQNPTNKNIQ